MILLSAVGEEREKVAALDAGADDYVTKPVGIDELLARLRAVLRRTSPAGEPVIELGELVVDLEKRAVTVAGEPVHLTPHQFELLRVLAVNRGKLLTHRALLQEVWGPGYGDASNLLHVNVSQLRRKIEPDRARPRYLLTEPGAGYRLVDPGRWRSTAVVQRTLRFVRESARDDVALALVHGLPSSQSWSSRQRASSRRRSARLRAPSSRPTRWSRSTRSSPTRAVRPPAPGS